MAETNKRIEKCLSFIKDNLTHVDSVVDKLIESDVIPMTERDSIVSKPLEREQIQSLLDVVTRKQKGDVFLAALVETKNEHVAVQIKSVKLSGEMETLVRSQTYGLTDRNNDDHAKTYDKVEKELKNTKEENDHLRALQKKLREQLGEKDNRLRELNKETIQCKNECKQLKDETEFLHKSLNEKEKQVQTLTDECKKLKKQIDQVEQNLKEKDEKVDTLSKNLNYVFNELHNRNENSKQILSDNKQLKTEVTELKNICTNISDSIKSMQSGRKPHLSNYRHVASWQTGWKGTSKQQETQRNKKK